VRVSQLKLTYSSILSIQPNPILAVGDLGDSITVPTALLDGDRVIKKFRRRRRLGVLVTSNAAIAAAKKAAANGIPITVTTAFRTPSTTQKRAPVSSSCIQAQSKAAPVAPRGELSDLEE
jgi:hypothetical protein